MFEEIAVGPLTLQHFGCRATKTATSSNLYPEPKPKLRLQRQTRWRYTVKIVDREIGSSTSS